LSPLRKRAGQSGGRRKRRARFAPQEVSSKPVSECKGDVTSTLNGPPSELASTIICCPVGCERHGSATPEVTLLLVIASARPFGIDSPPRTIYGVSNVAVSTRCLV
jgi:hypothetical protein